jgi:hypothetical protein
VAVDQGEGEVAPRRSRLEAPRSNFETPSFRLEAPRSNLETPSSRLETPRSNLETPSSEPEIPSSVLETRRSTPEIGSSAPETPRFPTRSIYRRVRSGINETQMRLFFVVETY